MPDEQEFLIRILERPDDDGPRLVYADWLNEHGQCERAEFIQLQCRLERMPQVPAKHQWRAPNWRLECLKLETRIRELKELQPSSLWLPAKKQIVKESLREAGVTLEFKIAEYKRGFAHAVRCDARTLEDVERDALAATTIHQIRLEDRPNPARWRTIFCNEAGYAGSVTTERLPVPLHHIEVVAPAADIRPSRDLINVTIDGVETEARVECVHGLLLRTPGSPKVSIQRPPDQKMLGIDGFSPTAFHLLMAEQALPYDDMAGRGVAIDLNGWPLRGQITALEYHRRGWGSDYVRAYVQISEPPADSAPGGAFG